MISKLLAVMKAIILLSASKPDDSAAQSLPRVMIRTDVGSLEVEVDTVQSPDAGGNFLSYVDHGAYKGGRFHRTFRAERLPGGKTEIEGIQGGLNPSQAKNAPPIAMERKKNTGLSLGDKELSFPPGGGDAGTADFFIRVDDRPELGRLEPDGRGFTAFGRVVRGREVVHLIHTARAKDHRLTPPIEILDVTRVK
jgi:peptidyl-prolyl cis-trans isomerase A (cyclophilin A)